MVSGHRLIWELRVDRERSGKALAGRLGLGLYVPSSVFLHPAVRLKPIPVHVQWRHCLEKEAASTACTLYLSSHGYHGALS